MNASNIVEAAIKLETILRKEADGTLEREIQERVNQKVSALEPIDTEALAIELLKPLAEMLTT